MVWFQRIDLRDNSVKVAGLMALALSMKVNTSVTQLDLDDIPKKKMVSISVIHFRSQSQTGRPDYGLHNHSHIRSVVYEPVDKKSPVYSFFPQSFLFCLFPAL